jgi:curved DNA-binding protein CbpA
VHSGASVGPIEDYYIVLGIPREASLEDVESAYFELARRLHPDVVGGGDEATARFMLINEAFQALSSPVLRREYDKSLGIQVDSKSYVIAMSRPSPGKPVPAAAPVAEAKAEPRAGAAQRLDDNLKRTIKSADRLCEQGNFWQAADLLQRIQAKYPRQPALRRALSRASSGMMRFREAAEHMKVACEIEYFNADNHVLLGEVYMKGKQWQKARDALRDALSWNEDHERAKKDLLVIEKELEKGDSPLKRLLHKLGRSVGGEQKTEKKQHPPREKDQEHESGKRG